jgi:hypothetical protein
MTLKIIRKPIAVNKNTGQEITGSEEVKFFGQISIKTFFVIIGKKFTLDCYTRRQHLCVSGPPIPRNPSEEESSLRLFIGPEDALEELAVHECEYFPFNPHKDVTISSKDYHFNFPAKFMPIILPLELKEQTINENFATCNNQGIIVFNNPDMSKPQNKAQPEPLQINHYRDLQKFKNRDRW